MKPFDWIGYLEHASTERLWDFTGNAGKGNCTIFAEIIKATQGRDLQELPWCCTFVHAVLNRPDILGRAHPGCRVLQRRMKRKGLWRGKDYIPQEYDLIFCSNAGTKRVDHCGIVERCDGETVVSIDGNTEDPSGNFPPQDGGAVARRTRKRHDPKIVGYAAIGNLILPKETNQNGP